MSRRAATSTHVADLPSRVETVVIGGGQAGLAMSWTLTQAGREHTQTSSLFVGVGQDAAYLGAVIGQATAA